MTNLLTIPEAFSLITAGLLVLRFVASVKPQEGARDILEASEGNYTTQPYLERYGAVIQSQQYH